MENTRFDDMAKALGTLATRRLTLGAILGAGLLGSTQIEAKRSSGKCKPACDACETCDRGKCNKKHGKKRCKKGRCKALTGTACSLPTGSVGTCCSGVCRDLQTDEANCGACDGACTSTQVCQTGLCFPVSICPPNTTVQCDPLTTPCGDGAGTCVCNRSTEGNVVCVELTTGVLCPDLIPCTSSATCSVGRACVEIGSCCTTPTHACLLKCPNPDA